MLSEKWYARWPATACTNLTNEELLRKEMQYDEIPYEEVQYEEMH